MSESPRSASGAGMEPKCSKPRGAVAAPDFVEVSPLMRSCIFGFNTHVAELPSSATDVKGSSTSILGPCQTLSAAETAVRKAFLSQLPAELLRKTWCNDGAAEKGRKLQSSPAERLLEDAPWWVASGRCKAEESGILPAEIRSGLAELGQEFNSQGEHKDSRPQARASTCKRGRQTARRLAVGSRTGYSPSLSNLGGDIGGNDSADLTAPSSASLFPEVKQPNPAEVGDSGTAGSTGEEQDGSDSGACGLLGALSVSLDKLAEGTDVDVGGPVGASPLLGSPTSPSHRAQDSCDSSLKLTDVALPLECSLSDRVPSGVGGPFICGATFSLPHGPFRSSQMLEDVAEPVLGCVPCEERQASGGNGERNAVRLPLDAGDVFAEVQMTLLALLEDLHAAACCCASATSSEPCGCCIGSPILVKSKSGHSSASAFLPRMSGPIGKTGACRGGVGEPPVSFSSGTRSPSPVPTRACSVRSLYSSPANQCSSLTGSLDTARIGCDATSCSPCLRDPSTLKRPRDCTDTHVVSPNAYRSGAPSTVSHAAMEVYRDAARSSSDCSSSTGGRVFSGQAGKCEERSDRDSPCASGSSSCSDPLTGAGAHSPSSSGARNNLRPPQKGTDTATLCGSDDPGDSLHLLFRHHVAVVACADLFAELLPYSHIFRDCVGTYRMPASLPSPARHLLVQDLLMLRQDPDRLLARNSFQWTDARGSLLCLADQTPYIPKSGGGTDLQHPDRMTRGDDMGGCLSGHGSGGIRTELVGSVRDERNCFGASDVTTNVDSTADRTNTMWILPLPLLDPTVLLCASGTELAAQKSAVLRILRMLRSLAPSWAARDDNFGFHFKTAITASSLDSPELQSYRVVLQCLSPFDAREWSREQLMEVLSDLDCIRLAHRRRRNLRASVARVQRFVEQPDGCAAGNTWHNTEGTGMSRQRWEINGNIAGYKAEGGAHLCSSRQVVRSSRDAYNGQHAANIATPTGSSSASGSALASGLVQPLVASKEQHSVFQQVVGQQPSTNGSGGKGTSRASTVAAKRYGGADGVAYSESDGEQPVAAILGGKATVVDSIRMADLQALAAGKGASLMSGAALPASSVRRGQSPVGTSVGGRRNASAPDVGGKAGNSSPSDCPVRQQYAVRAAELPKIKGVFIGKKHTCWVAQWNDANGQPRQSCFNIKQHGFEKARCLAVQARQALMGMPASKSTSTPPTDAQRTASQPVQQVPPATREAAPMPARLPDLMRDATTAIAEALGSRSVHTPTAVVPPIKSKLEGILNTAEGHGVSVGHGAPSATFSSSFPSSFNATQAKLTGSGAATPRNSPRGALQRPASGDLRAELSATPAAPQPEGQKQESDRAPSSAPSLTSSGTSSKQQLLLQHKLQQQLEEQLQQLRQLQQQLMQQSLASPQPAVGTLSLLPDVVSRPPKTSSCMGLVDSSSSAMALLNSLLGSSTTGLQHVSPPVDREQVDSRDPSGSLSALRSPEAHQQPAVLSGAAGQVNELQNNAQGPKPSRGDACVLGAAEESAGALRASCGQAEALEEDGMPASSKRKNRLLYVQKQGKRTLASLAREFPSVGGVTYNVKCACWEVTVKGRESAKVFSTRKFGSLEAAYGAAVMWKRKVERGEQGADDADGPDGQEDDCDDLEESEGLGGSPSPGTWETGPHGDELSRKRAACFMPDVFGTSLSVSVQQQEVSSAAPQASVDGTHTSDTGNSQADILPSRASGP